MEYYFVDQENEELGITLIEGIRSLHLLELIQY